MKELLAKGKTLEDSFSKKNFQNLDFERKKQCLGNFFFFF